VPEEVKAERSHFLEGDIRTTLDKGEEQQG
jgi:hypothetical protein